MLDKLAPPAEETARETTEAWIKAFGAALSRGDERALSGLLAEDGHWRNLFGLSWQFATFSGNDVLARELLRCACEAGAESFRIDPSPLPPRRSVMAGREVIEAIFSFNTTNGPRYGALRLLPAADGLARAWTISTSLDFDRICDERVRHAAPTSQMRDFAAPDWIEQREASSTYDGRDPDVLIVGGGHTGISAAVELKRIGLSA
jgi:hypothetical protein